MGCAYTVGVWAVNSCGAGFYLDADFRSRGPGASFNFGVGNELQVAGGDGCVQAGCLQACSVQKFTGGNGFAPVLSVGAKVDFVGFLRPR